MESSFNINSELRSFSKRPLKRHGQNFLKDVSVCKQIVKNIRIENGSRVVEIGPGLGILTNELLQAGFRVKAVEIDADLVDYLQNRFENVEKDRIEIVNQDAVRLIREGGLGDNPYIVSNLPYNISSSLMGELLDSIDLSKGTRGFSEAIIMFQREFGERLVAGPGSKTYGKISAMFSLKMEHEVLFKVSRTKFFPQPKVDGIVLRFRPNREPSCIPSDDSVLRKVLTVAFINRRKMLRNSLNPHSIDVDISDDEMLGILESRGISDRRPETLGPCDFVELSNLFVEASR
ncbi:MAG: 16S rRNA (adenine(1518)-N(6)/adenine(1519)-N(6))-dimethyltransferase RsmA [Thermoplasmatota archaeon]